MVKLSQWHSEYLKPVHAGVYQRLYNEGLDGEVVVYCLWDKVWFCYAMTPHNAVTNCAVSDNRTKWRGIVK
jgi:hypothetical protein